MKIFVITQIRYSSSRLPGKILKKFGKQTFLDVFLNRLKRIKNISGVICAIANEDNNKKIIKIATKHNCLVFIGSKDNVLQRIFSAAKKYNAEAILRVTSDCPLIDPEICNQVIKKFLSKKYDYVSNNLIPSFPHGLDCEIFSFQALNQSVEVFKKTKDLSIKEHVTPYIKKSNKFKKYNLISTIKLKRYQRWTLDNQTDLKFFKKLSKFINSNEISTISWKSVLKLIEKNKDLQTINNVSHHFWF